MSDAKIISMEQITEKLDELPTLPSIIYELSQVINNPMSSTSEVEVLMSNDLSLTTKVLKLANSAYYAIPGGVSSLDRAISNLGFDTVNQLVLSTSILDTLSVSGSSSFNVKVFWKHSIGVGIAAETIANFTHHPLPSDMFTSGLVHDMGKVAHYTIDPEGVDKISSNAREKNITYLASEKELNTPMHTTIGNLLAINWQLPPHLQAAIKYHHQYDPKLRSGLSAELNQTVDIVTLANTFIHALDFGNSGYKKVLNAPKKIFERLTIDPDSGFTALALKINHALIRGEGFIRLIAGKDDEQ